MVTSQFLLVADTLITHCQRSVDEIRRTFSRPGPGFNALVSDANRTYLAIWEHLVTAHEQLSQEGRNLEAFDEVCAALAPDLTAVVVPADQVLVRSVEHIDVNTNQTVIRNEYRPLRTIEDEFGVQTIERAYEFNDHGLEVARGASLFLKQAMPEVDWIALSRAAAVPAPDLTAASPKTVLTVAAIGLVVVVVLIAIFR